MLDEKENQGHKQQSLGWQKKGVWLFQPLMVFIWISLAKVIARRDCE